MQNEHLISASEFCTHYKVEYAFISSLQQSGLIETTTIQNTTFIDIAQIQNLEKIIRLHYDLDINIEGIEAITGLLNRMENMQQEITYLRNKLHFYEGSE